MSHMQSQTNATSMCPVKMKDSRLNLKYQNILDTVLTTSVLQVWWMPSWSSTSWGATESSRGSGFAGRAFQTASCTLSSNNGRSQTQQHRATQANISVVLLSFYPSKDFLNRNSPVIHVDFSFSVIASWILLQFQRTRLWTAGRLWRSCWALWTSTTASTSLDTIRCRYCE